jgi:hypothetical protein
MRQSVMRWRMVVMEAKDYGASEQVDAHLNTKLSIRQHELLKI